MSFPSDKLQSMLPYIKLGLCALNIAIGITAKSVGLNVDLNLFDLLPPAVSQSCAHLKDVRVSDFSNSMTSFIAGKGQTLLEWSEKLANSSTSLTQSGYIESYRNLKAILVSANVPDFNLCGLVKMIADKRVSSASTSSVFWILESEKTKFATKYVNSARDVPVVKPPPPPPISSPLPVPPPFAAQPQQPQPPTPTVLPTVTWKHNLFNDENMIGGKFI